MQVSKFCHDFLIFNVYYKVETFESPVVRKFIFPIDYSEKDVMTILSQEKYEMEIDEVEEVGYALQLK
ncbi:hypothetical protein G7081_03565 [Vagococcus coleopterorum]|uniref:Uncharacterized protein n=1 Tax=Vagococcus coleopterorum TaxID=2714946 RepID=A0A6G8AMA5_9ENTE|nr:hypothetical protein [Vagococcus coleopterorum]QIL46214.1 hypothetical protein G7081_03565 [Vagococcus coleopterorum]